jgi:DUF4097 and DUF4098 domain-containing protein YvlB
MSNTHEVPPGARLRVLAVSGKVRVIGEERSDIEIEPDSRRIHLVDDGKVLETKAHSGDVVVRVPEGLNVSVGSVSGEVDIDGTVGSVKVSTVSGSVEIEHANGDADVRSISGTIIIAACGGRARANTKSGRIEIGHVGGAIQAHTMSGRIEIGTAGQDEVEIKTISGSIEVKVDEGRAPRAKLRSLSGKARCNCPQGADFEIKASSISGSIEVNGK